MKVILLTVKRINTMKWFVDVHVNVQSVKLQTLAFEATHLSPSWTWARSPGKRCEMRKKCELLIHGLSRVVISERHPGVLSNDTVEVFFFRRIFLEYLLRILCTTSQISLRQCIHDISLI